MDKWKYIGFISKASDKYGNLLIEMMDRYHAINLTEITEAQAKEFYEERILKMRGNEYQELASRTMNKSLEDYECEFHALHGMVGEIGEIHSIYQKDYQGHALDENHLKKEVGDLLWFIAEYCTSHGWKLEDVMQLNIDKLKARFPEGFDAEHSLNRKEGDI